MLKALASANAVQNSCHLTVTSATWATTDFQSVVPVTVTLKGPEVVSARSKVDNVPARPITMARTVIAVLRDITVFQIVNPAIATLFRLYTATVKLKLVSVRAGTASAADSATIVKWAFMAILIANSAPATLLAPPKTFATTQQGTVSAKLATVDAVVTSVLQVTTATLTVSLANVMTEAPWDLSATFVGTAGASTASLGKGATDVLQAIIRIRTASSVTVTPTDPSAGLVTTMESACAGPALRGKNAISARKDFTTIHVVKDATVTLLVSLQRLEAAEAFLLVSFASAKRGSWVASVISADRFTGTSSQGTHMDVKNVSALLLEQWAE